jgi:L-ribulokinase
VLNQVYADVLGKTVLVPDGVPTSLGSGIFAFLAAGVFTSIEEAQQKMCLPFKAYTPRVEAVALYDELFRLYREVYFAFGRRGSAAATMGDVLPELRRIAARTRIAASEM